MNKKRFVFKHLPNFGPFLNERKKRIAEFKETDDLLAEKYQPKSLRPANQPSNPVPPIRAIIAAAVNRIGTYADLDNKQQVVAMIDEVIGRYSTNSKRHALNFFSLGVLDRKCVSIVASVI